MKNLSGRCPRSLVVLALLCAGGSVSAADLGFYVVIDGAANKAAISLPEFNSSITDYWLDTDPNPIVTDVDADTNAKSYQFTVGYQLGSYFAIEGSYFDFGKIRYRYTATFSQFGGPYNGRLTFRPRGPTVSAVGLLPLGPYFSADAHAGFAFVDSKYKLPLTNSSGSNTVSDDEYSFSKTSLYVGGGVAWWITGQVALRLGYNRFHKFEKIFDSDATQYTLGLRYSYGY